MSWIFETSRARKKEQEISVRLSFIEKELSLLRQKMDELNTEKSTLISNLELIKYITGNGNSSLSISIKHVENNPKFENKKIFATNAFSQESLMDEILTLISTNWQMLSRDVVHSLNTSNDEQLRNDIHNTIKKLERLWKIKKLTEYKLDGSIKTKNTPYTLSIK